MVPVGWEVARWAGVGWSGAAGMRARRNRPDPRPIVGLQQQPTGANQPFGLQASHVRVQSVHARFLISPRRRSGIRQTPGLFLTRLLAN
jgi:hypothetical protein